PWLSPWRRTAALRSWVLGQGLRERCLPTPRPLAVLHRRRHGFKYEGYLLTEKVPEARDLHAYLAELVELKHAERWSRLRRTSDQVARAVLGLHRRMLSHRDLKAANILMPPARSPLPHPHAQDAGVPVNAQWPWLIDLVGLPPYHRLRRARRVQNLARLHA